MLRTWKPFDRCECDHLATDHDPEEGNCQHDDCTCAHYTWDRDQGGIAVTRSSSTPKT